MILLYEFSKLVWLPIAQISAFCPYAYPLHTSGGINDGVPTNVLARIA